MRRVVQDGMSGGCEVGRRRGRPRSAQAHATVATWLPSDVHDRLIRAANDREMSVSALVRRVLIVTLR